ncbi:hypothetical protein HOY80DRAFT_1112578 [Tuber brumale]|nr:hypothetical protein HOY80DRAFT_1112578 [Tuber brumale]
MCSSFLQVEDEEYLNILVTTASKEMTLVNYWHKLECLYIPVHVEMEEVDHWVLLRVLIGTQQNYIEVYDSLENTFTSEAEMKTMKFLHSLRNSSYEDYIKHDGGKEAEKMNFSEKDWIWKRAKENHPKQEDSLDCAIFVMQSGLLLLQGEVLDYKQDDIPNIRKTMLGIFYANMMYCQDWRLKEI